MAIKKVILPEEGVRWEVTVRVGDRDSRRLRRRFEKKADAEEFMLGVQKERQSIKFGAFSKSPEEATFASESMFWLNCSGNKFSSAHLKRVAAIVRRLNLEFGERSILKLTPEFISFFQQDMLARGLSHASVNKITNVIRAVLNLSVKYRRIPRNPAQGFQQFTESGSEMKFWSLDEAKDFLSFANKKYPEWNQGRWIYVVYLLALNTALRSGEIWGLKPFDVPPSGGILFVRRQLERLTRKFTETKGKSARSVPCNVILRTEIQKLVEREKVAPHQTIFRNEKGEPINHDNFIKRVFQKDIAEWGGREIRFHDLRHTATTLMIYSGVDVRTVQGICGHADIKTTMNYMHLISGAVEQVAERFFVQDEPVARKEESKG